MIAKGFGIAGVLAMVLIAGCRETPTPTSMPTPPPIQALATATSEAAQQLLGPTTTPLPAKTLQPTQSPTIRAPTNTRRATSTTAATATIKPANTQPRPTNTGMPLPTNPPATQAPLPTQPPPPTNYDRNGDGKVTCKDFGTQAEAQAAYAAGHTNLDGNDNDGLACESLP